ncbi:MAG: type II secretion system protein [Leptothrix sp. (in: b-proteobacteria)]
MNLARRRHGFTLIELIISVAILSLLASGAMGLAELAVRRGKEQDLRVALRQIREAIDSYKQASDASRIRRAADETGYPRSLDELSDGVPDARSSTGAKLFFLRSLPRDPMAAPGLSAAESWGVRSYASEPDRPQSGRDVYDVFSRSTRAGLNGQPYRNW